MIGMDEEREREREKERERERGFFLRKLRATCVTWYIYIYSCNAIYIGYTSERLEVRVKQHVPRDIRNHTTSEHLKLLGSAICEHLNALNSCVVNYRDECFAALHRARTKQHLIVLEAIYILLNWPSLCKQNPKHSLNLLRDIFCLT